MHFFDYNKLTIKKRKSEALNVFKEAAVDLNSISKMFDTSLNIQNVYEG